MSLYICTADSYTIWTSVLRTQLKNKKKRDGRVEEEKQKEEEEDEDSGNLISMDTL